MYQVLVKYAESRNAVPAGPLSFVTARQRQDFVDGVNGYAPAVYWYHFAEWDNWHQWRRGGAWEATQEPGPADRVNTPPEITEEDRW